jgi:hypothetical protein
MPSPKSEPLVLSVLPTTPARMKHDYVRHGTTTSLFAALDIASGSVIAQHYRRHPTRSPCGSSSSSTPPSPTAWTAWTCT